MKTLQNLFTPFGTVSKPIKWGIGIFWFLFFFLLFEVTHSPIIPSSTSIVKSLGHILSTEGFYDDLLSSLVFTLKAMFYALLITMILCYLAPIEFFKPTSAFISKCRYLTLTGLIFLFSVLTSNLGQMKMSLLIYGIVPYFVTSFLSVVVATNEQEIHKSYVNRNNKWETLWEVIIIGKLDQLFETARQNFAIAWLMITMVEGFAINEGGIGTQIIKSNKTYDLSTVFAILIIILILGLFFDFLISKLRVLLFPYIQK